MRTFNGGAAGAWVRRALAQGEAYVSAEPERERDHGVADSVPDAAHAPVATTGHLAVLNSKSISRRFRYSASSNIFSMDLRAFSATSGGTVTSNSGLGFSSTANTLSSVIDFM